MKRKIATLFFTAALLVAHIIVVGMDYPGMEKDYPQLQLQEPEKNPIKSAQATLKLTSSAVYSLALSFDPNLQACFPGKPMRYIGDPVVSANLLLKNDAEISGFDIGIPAKQLFNLDNGSIIQLYILNKKNPEDSRFITAVCQNNPKIEPKNRTFRQQFESAMASFYDNPSTADHTCKAKLITENVIKEKYLVERSEIGFGFFRPEGQIRIEHGERGCPNQEAFIKSIIKPKTKPYGNSIYQLVTQRQLGAKKWQPLATNPDRILDNCLRIMELEIAAESNEITAENNILDNSFRELQINCLLTHLFIKNRIARLFIEFLDKQR